MRRIVGEYTNVTTNPNAPGKPATRSACALRPSPTRNGTEYLTTIPIFPYSLSALTVSVGGGNRGGPTETFIEKTDGKKEEKPRKW